MCGIAALWSPLSSPDLAFAIRAATAAIAHRGPDGDGIWMESESGIALGHRRLAIVDLTDTGRQPMLSSDGRYCLTFNGEIYNFLSLRADLERIGHRFRGGSDTEVMLAAFLQWGVQDALRKFVGMFAFALWDRKERQLFLARDRLGKKPLYFGWVANGFAVASELKALREIPGFKNGICAAAVRDFAMKACVPAPLSIYERIYKLMPGHLLCVDPVMASSQGRSEDWSHQSQPYWDVHREVTRASRNRYAGSVESAMSDLLELLRDAVRIRMIADVPLGAFLSGGIDSSIVVALMQQQASVPVKTYTIGYADADYDESNAAASIARHLGTNHTSILLTEIECQRSVAEMPRVFDEPFADSSQIPTLLVSRHARHGVTVALTGDGGDELFGGYNRHYWLPRIWKQAGWLPRPARSALSTLLGASVNLNPRAILKILSSASGHRQEHRLAGDKLGKIAAVLAASGLDGAYEALAGVARRPFTFNPALLRDSAVIARNVPEGLCAAERLMYLDMTSYLPDDVLVKVDRATMASSLESRAPLLDHRVAEFAWTLPPSMKIRGSTGKWILRRLLQQLMPGENFDRSKMGFAIPIGDWLKGPLRPWAEELLRPERIRDDGYFNPAVVSLKWSEHLSGRSNHQFELWTVLMFNAWKDSIS